MEREPTVDELLRRWQDLRERRESPTVEDLCADCPEKTAELRERLQAVASMMSLLGLEPESGSTGSLSTEDHGRPARPRRSADRRRSPAPTRPAPRRWCGSPATRCSASWDEAAWVWSTRLDSTASVASLRSR